MNDVNIREISKTDNAALGEIIRSVLMEYDAHHGGTAFDDPELDHMFEAYQNEGSIYFVAEVNGSLVGGAGIKRLDGNLEGYCELQKMYLLPQTRGLGVGKTLMEKCLKFAKEAGYEHCYLETLGSMEGAQLLYRKFGFEVIDRPLGDTGHFGCNVWMLKKL